MRTFTSIFLRKTWWSIRLLLARNPYWTKVLLRSLRYWRVGEFPFVLQNLPASGRLRILDISSPKILAYHISQELSHEVVAIDLWSKEIEMWRSISDSIYGKGDAGGVLLDIQDATSLSFGDESFDVAYSVSVIEHIDSPGDTNAMKEIARVLRKGGLALVTVPFDKAGYDVWKDKNVYNKEFSGESVFYERWYNEGQLKERLIGPSGLHLVNVVFLTEKYYRVHKKLMDRMTTSSFVVGNSWGLLEPFIGLINLRSGSSPTGVDEGIAMLVLRKAGTQIRG